MADIDDVISRSRLGGEFKERKSFTLARHRAIRKMREFALADPHYYCLELIQAAVANGAKAINLEFTEDEVLFSYVGGGLASQDLAHLFDFLFASKDRLEVGHLRELALGINALLLFEPETVVLESGDGSPGNTTRMVVQGRTDSVDVGRGDAPLNGTYLRARGLHRAKIAGRSLFRFNEDLPAEARAIEERCLTAPVPILVNGEAPFGYRTMRIPRLWGYEPTTTFDEDELYGTVGLPMFSSTATFRLLTYGVWVQTVEKNLGAGRRVGGVINFDRLRKTADHSAIVQDDVLEEMWIRVRPYAMKLTGARAGATLHDVRRLGGEPVRPKALRELLRAQRYVVVTSDRHAGAGDRARRAEAIGSALAAPVLVAPDSRIDALRQLGGTRTGIVTPSLESDAEVAFYQGKPAAPPPEPWLAAAELLAPVATAALAAAISKDVTVPLVPTSPAHIAEAVLDTLGRSGEVAATLFAPEDAGPAAVGVWARVLVSDRIAWQGRLPSAHPGQWLDVRLPDIPPLRVASGLGLPGLADVPVGELIASAVLKGNSAAQASLDRRALRCLASFGDQVGGAARRLALRVMARSGVLRFRAGREDPALPGARIALLGEPDALLDLPVAKTLDGRDVSIARLLTAIDDTGGLIYGVIPEVPPDLAGLDRSRVLALEQFDERMLVMLFGDAAYVRVDRRDVLAVHDGARCRDLAIGLRDYPSFPLLVEGTDPSAWPAERQRECLASLLAQLRDYFTGRRPAQPEDPADFPEWEENRRHACRHLQWFVCRRLATDPDEDMMGLDDLPLFLGPDGEAYDIRDVHAALQRPEGLVIQYREGLGRAELGRLSEAAADRRRPAHEPPRALATTLFVARLLAPLGRLRYALDFDLSDREARANPGTPQTAFIASRPLHGEQFSGAVGVPAGSGVEPAIVLLDGDGRQLTALQEEARTNGVVGFIKLREARLGTGEAALAAELRDTLAGAIERATAEVIGDLIERVSESPRSGPALPRIERAILDYGARHLSLLANPNGVVVPMVLRPAAQAALDLPLFPTGDGGAVSAWRLVTEFCALGAAAFQESRTTLSHVLASGAPAHLIDWIESTLIESRVTRLGSSATRRDVPRSIWPAANQDRVTMLAQNLTYWLERLRPDDDLVTATGQRMATRVTIEPPLSEPDWKRPWMPSGDTFAIYHERTNPGTGRRVTGSWLYLNADHLLVRKAVDSMPDADELAWLLLASYAHINERRQPVTNDHERAFQLRIAAALRDGELEVVGAELQNGEANDPVYTAG